MQIFLPSGHSVLSRPRNVSDIALILDGLVTLTIRLPRSIAGLRTLSLLSSPCRNRIGSVSWIVIDSAPPLVVAWGFSYTSTGANGTESGRLSAALGRPRESEGRFVVETVASVSAEAVEAEEAVSIEAELGDCGVGVYGGAKWWEGIPEFPPPTTRIMPGGAVMANGVGLLTDLFLVRLAFRPVEEDIACSNSFFATSRGVLDLRVSGSWIAGIVCASGDDGGWEEVVETRIDGGYDGADPEDATRRAELCG